MATRANQREDRTPKAPTFTGPEKYSAPAPKPKEPTFTGPAKYSPYVPPAPPQPPKKQVVTPKAPAVDPLKAMSERLQAQADAYFAANPDIDPLTGKKRTTVVNQAPVDEEVKEESKQDEISKEDKDAFALLKDLFASYGLDELYPVIEGYMKSGMGPSEAKIKLKSEQAYKDRFKGNEVRRSKGLNVLSEAEYLDLENSYSETLKAYGLQNYFGSAVTTQDRKNRNLKIADVIGNDISAVEFKDRVSTAVDRVANADAFTKTAFNRFYNIGEAELIGYFLDPQKALVNLKEKAAAAEIGGAALGQQLAASVTSAEDLARFGISREQAQVGYANIAEILPTAGKLSQIYAQEGITYGQTEAEAETFKGLASEQRKRQRLVARETGAFGGASGITKGALSRGAGGAI